MTQANASTQTGFLHVHYSAHLHTTPGHRAIARTVACCARHAGALASMSIPRSVVLSDILTWVRQSSTVFDTKCIVITMDTPDDGSDAIVGALVQVLESDSFVVSVVLLSIKLHRDQYSRTDSLKQVDFCVALEPGVAPNRAWRQSHVDRAPLLHVAPLVGPRVVQDESAADQLLQSILYLLRADNLNRHALVIVSGLNSERAAATRFAMRELAKEGLIPVCCQSIQDALSARAAYAAPDVAFHFPRIVASSGYSTFWELTSVGLDSRVAPWLVMNRPLEDINGRLRLLQKRNVLNASLTTTSRTGHKTTRNGAMELARLLARIARATASKPLVLGPQRKDSHVS